MPPLDPRGAAPDGATVPPMTWAERAADRSPVVQRSRSRGVEQARAIVHAAQRLIEVKGPTFTTQELVKEAGIALQTFYRYFPGKDHLLLAVIENFIDENCKLYAEKARELGGPLERLRYYVTATLEGLEGSRPGPNFITSEHWRLQMLYPDEISRATKPFNDLVVAEIHEAIRAGLLDTPDPDYSAWLVTQLVVSVFHHYDCSGLTEPRELIGRRLWEFCLRALGGDPALLGGRRR